MSCEASKTHEWFTVEGLKELGAVVDMVRVSSLADWASENDPKPWAGF